MRVERLLDAAQAGGGAAAAGVAAGRIVVVQLAHRPAAGDRTLVEVVQELLVAERVDAEPPLLRLVQTPADVVMAAQVVDEPAVLRQGVQRVDLRLEQTGVAVGERAPQVDHRGDIVQHVAFGVFRGAEVGGELLGGHHHLAFEDHGRADAFEGDAQHADDGVHLRQVAAGGAQLLPDVGHGVDAQHLHAQVRQVQRAGQHGHQHLGVAVVEVPLERVEGGQHPLVHLVAPAEVAGRGVREDLRGGPLVFVGDRAIVVAEVVVLVFGVSGLGLHGPFVGGGGVVHHEVEAQADAGLAQFLGQGGQVGVGAERGVHGVEVLDRVAAVVLRVRHLEQRHQVQVGQVLLLQVGDAVGELAQAAGEQVGVHGHAEHRAALVPVGVGLALLVELLQVVGAGLVGGGHGLFKVLERGTVVVQAHEQLVQFVVMPGQTVAERVVDCGGNHYETPSSIGVYRQAPTISNRFDAQCRATPRTRPPRRRRCPRHREGGGDIVMRSRSGRVRRRTVQRSGQTS